MNNPTNGLNAFKFDMQERCRICRVISTNLNSIFDDNGSGSAFDFASKINEYLPITVSNSCHSNQVNSLPFCIYFKLFFVKLFCFRFVNRTICQRKSVQCVQQHC